MRIRIRHRTVYAFDAPMRWITQSHRLTPTTCAGQKVVDWSVTAEGATFGAGFIDGGGDEIRTMTIAGPVERVEVVVEGTVETADSAGVLRGHRETIAPLVYLVSTPATRPSPALIELKEKALEGADPSNALGMAHRLSEAVAKAIAYGPGETTAQTTAAEALELGKGVCQDYAHALISVAHLAGLPARYAVGYLLSRDDGSPEDASHAWAEIHLPGLGWVGFDPTNDCCPDERYVRLGAGRDAQDGAPIRGVSRGGAGEAIEVSVEVWDAAQKQSQQ